MQNMQNYFTGNERQIDKITVRVFVADEEGGKPVSGVVVSIVAEPPRDMDTAREEQAPSLPIGRMLATLQTDQAGYASFKFDPAILAGASQLTVAYGTSRRNALTLNVADLLAGNDVHTIRVDASALNLSDPSPGLPAVMSPDCRDAILSPGSIGSTPQLSPDRGLCSQLMPTALSVRRFEAIQVLADICIYQELRCREPVQIVRGSLLEYDVSWLPAGTALGDLLNSITLAPCEQVNIAVADWMRRETASQTQSIDIQQQRFEQTDHDRLIAETMNSSVGNKSRVWGVAGASGGAAHGIPLSKLGDKGPTMDLTAALGGGISGSTSTQTIAAQTTNKLSERITQSASLVASQRSSVVFQATASEQHTYQTRTIRNHNHCHTLTMMYYQVNRNYCVVTEYKGKREVILVKYDIKDFDARRAYCNAEVLKDALLDPSLIGCFDELADALFCCDMKPGESTANKMLIDSLIITALPKEVQLYGSMEILLYSATSGLNALVSTGHISIQWIGGGVFKHTANLLPTPVDAGQVAWMEIRLYSPHAGLGSFPPYAILNEFEVLGHGPGHDDLVLYSSKTEITMNSQWRSPVEAKLPEPHAGVENECVAASCCIQKLLGHLNCHKRYYNAILWLNEDPDERVMRWSCCDQGNDLPFSLMAQIVNTPITVYGDYLVFPVANSPLVGDPSVLPLTRIITMPTPGVYAEGILGQCDTCEIINPDRRWDWKDSPCPDNAPAVGSPPSPQTGTQLSDLKADALTSLISFSSVPGAPESGIKDLITTLLANADKGSAEAKDMLEKLLETIKASIPAAAPKT